MKDQLLWHEVAVQVERFVGQCDEHHGQRPGTYRPQREGVGATRARPLRLGREHPGIMARHPRMPHPDRRAALRARRRLLAGSPVTFFR